MKILVFLHGTVIMHSSAVGVPREERVRQSAAHEPSVRDFASYVPVGDAVSKLHTWVRRGAEVVYLSSHRKAEDVRKDEEALRRYGFPGDRFWNAGRMTATPTSPSGHCPMSLSRTTASPLEGPTRWCTRTCPTL